VLFKGVLSGLSQIAQYVQDPSFSSILILLPYAFDPHNLICLDKHRFLPSSFAFISSIMTFLLPSETCTVEIRRFNPSNPKGPGFALHEELSERTQIFFAAHPDPPLSNKVKVFANWKRDYMDAQHNGQAWQSCEIPESSTPLAQVYSAQQITTAGNAFIWLKWSVSPIVSNAILTCR